MEKSQAVKKRDQVENSDKWRIEKVYKNIEEWEAEFEKLKAEAPHLKEFSGKLGDANELLNYFKCSEKISRVAEKLFVYAHLRSDEDTSNPKFQILKNKIDSYIANLKSMDAYFVPEILALKEGTLEKEISEKEELKMYEFKLKDILNLKPHTLSSSEEKLLASVSDCLEGPANIYSILSNADMKFPKIKDENEEEVELTESKYNQFIKSKDRRVRKEAFEALFKTYGKYKNTFATSLTSSISNFNFVAKTRKYDSALESSLKPNNIPVKVYENTVDTINKNLDSLHRYVRIKKKLLGLDEIHMYDLYVPVVDAPTDRIEFTEAVDMVKKGLKPLGEEYLNIFSQGIEDGWIDKYENVAKRGGAYSWGCFDTMPYVLLNYNYGLNDVSTLAHEMGHSIHSYYSRKTQPFIYADYTLFCAEVASTTNEILLINYLINKEEDEKKKLYLINQQLEQIRTTVFRQVMFAEFEKITHESIENGTPLSGDDLCKIWHELNVKYFGEDMIVDEDIDMEWSRIPHFYSDFYVYQYATGYSAANSFSNMILKDGESAVEKYKGFLKSGGSDYSTNILAKAGVDMMTPKPIQDTIDRFNELLDMLEEK